MVCIKGQPAVALMDRWQDHVSLRRSEQISIALQSLDDRKPYISAESLSRPVDMEELSWAAGYLEGEMCVAQSGHKSIRLVATSIDYDSLERLQQALGGTIALESPRCDRWNPCWRWSILGVDAIDTAIAIYPLLGVRRRDRIRKLLSQLASAKAYSNPGLARRTFDSSQHKQMLALHHRGWSLSQIVAEVGGSRNSVWNLLKGNTYVASADEVSRSAPAQIRKAEIAAFLSGTVS